MTIRTADTTMRNLDIDEFRREGDGMIREGRHITTDGMSSQSLEHGSRISIGMVRKINNSSTGSNRHLDEQEQEEQVGTVV
jgi:hypothetical protein